MVDFTQIRRGTRIHGVQISHPLEGGSQSRVFAGQDAEGRRWVLKLPLSGEDGLDRLQQVASRIGPHPRLLVGVPLRRPACVRVPWVDGHTLCVLDLLPGRVPILLAQLVDLLEALHDRGVVHRDLKPENLLLSDDGLHLIDFGSAVCDPRGPIAPEGSPAYMPPEALLRWQVGPATDFYSLGILLFQLVTGTLPFDGPSLQQDLLRKDRGPLPQVTGSEADAWWTTLLHNLLDPDPEERWSGPQVRGHLLLYRDATRTPTPVGARCHAPASACRGETA